MSVACSLYCKEKVSWAASGQAEEVLQGWKVEGRMGRSETLERLGSIEERKLNKTECKGRDVATLRTLFKEPVLILCKGDSMEPINRRTRPGDRWQISGAVLEACSNILRAWLGTRTKDEVEKDRQ